VRRGFTLIEVVVALLLLELAVTSALGTLTIASHRLGEAERMERVVTEAEGILDSLAGVPEAESGTRAVAGGTIEWAVGTDGAVALIATRDDGWVWLDVTSALTRP
jgi:prepilin-type N-terminal cleavage/methylation domain-containing protein